MDNVKNKTSEEDNKNSSNNSKQLKSNNVSDSNWILKSLEKV
jgi:hypothetical protein